MTNRPPTSGDDRGTVYEREPGGRIPRWVKVLGLVTAVVILLVVLLLFLFAGDGDGDGGGGHGARPARQCAQRQSYGPIT